MRLTSAVLVAAASVPSLVRGQQTAWGQCGGEGINTYDHVSIMANADKGSGWTGKTSCVSGYMCQVQNTYYSTFVQKQNNLR
jgi:cellulose 1,4-beta-cellobiosidase